MYQALGFVVVLREHLAPEIDEKITKHLKLEDRGNDLMFEYKMVQIPPNVVVDMKKHKGNEAAAYLESVVNKYASQGWEFYRTDSIGVALKPGCLSALAGKKEEHGSYYVITFRKNVL